MNLALIFNLTLPFLLYHDSCLLYNFFHFALTHCQLYIVNNLHDLADFIVKLYSFLKLLRCYQSFELIIVFLLTKGTFNMLLSLHWSGIFNQLFLIALLVVRSLEKYLNFLVSNLNFFVCLLLQNRNVWSVPNLLRIITLILLLLLSSLAV